MLLRKCSNVLLWCDLIHSRVSAGSGNFPVPAEAAKGQEVQSSSHPQGKKNKKPGQPSHPELHRINSCLAHTVTFVLVSAAADEAHKENFKLN